MNKDEIFLNRRIQRLAEIENNKSIKYCYIIKQGSYYKKSWSGFAEYRHMAGVYSKKDAISEARRCSFVTIMPVDVEEHNKMVYAQIKELRSMLIR